MGASIRNKLHLRFETLCLIPGKHLFSTLDRFEMEWEGGDNSLIINILQIIQPGEVSVIGDGFIFKRHT